MEPRICAQYTSAAYDEDPESLWKKLEEGYRKALGLELYHFRRSLFDCTFDTYRTAAEYVHEIERIIECLREAEEEIKPREKTFYLLNCLPSSWREWHDLQATILKPDQPEDLIAAIKARESTMNRDKGGISKKTRFCIHTHLNAPCSGVCIWSASCASHESSFKLQKPKWTCKCSPLGLKIHVCLRNC